MKFWENKWKLVFWMNCITSHAKKEGNPTQKQQQKKPF